jgi:hypothetical protein
MDSKSIPSLRPAGMPSPSLGSCIPSLRSAGMLSPSAAAVRLSSVLQKFG